MADKDIIYFSPILIEYRMCGEVDFDNCVIQQTDVSIVK